MFVGCVCDDDDVRTFEHFLDQLIRHFTSSKPVFRVQKVLKSGDGHHRTDDDVIIEQTMLNYLFESEL